MAIDGRILEEFAMSLAVSHDVPVADTSASDRSAVDRRSTSTSFTPRVDAPLPVQRGSFPLRLNLRHGGSVDVADNMPTGTRFIIELPA